MIECRFYAGNTDIVSKAAADYISAKPYWIEAARKCNRDLYNTLKDKYIIPVKCGKMISRVLFTTPHICSAAFEFEGKKYTLAVDLLEWSVTVV